MSMTVDYPRSPSTFSIEQLQCLREVANELQVTFTLDGGVPFRFFLNHHYSTVPTDIADLFDLTPFTANVNLLHSGGRDLTRKVTKCVLERVPNADCFQWIIWSDEPREGAVRPPSVPARRLRLTLDGVFDPEDGLRDIRDRQFRFVRHDRSTPAALEILSALLYLQTISEAGLSEDEVMRQPGRELAQEIFGGVTKNNADFLLGNHPVYKRRICNRLLKCIAAAPPSMLTVVAQSYGLLPFINQTSGLLGLPDDLTRHLASGSEVTALSPSAWLGDNEYRVPLITGLWKSDWIKSKLDDCFHKHGDFSSGQRVLLASPTVDVAGGAALASSMAPSRGSEFICFAIVGNQIDPSFDERNLSAVVALRPKPPTLRAAANLTLRLTHRATARRMGAARPDRAPNGVDRERAPSWSNRASGFISAFARFVQPRWDAFTVPCIVQRPRNRSGVDGRIFIRINMLGLAEAIAGWSGAEAQFFLVGLSES